MLSIFIIIIMVAFVATNKEERAEKTTALEVFYPIPCPTFTPDDCPTLTVGEHVISQGDMYCMLLCDGGTFVNGNKRFTTSFGEMYNHGHQLMGQFPEGIIYLESPEGEQIIHDVNVDSVKAAFQWLYA